MSKNFPYEPKDFQVALSDKNFYLWDTSVIKVDGRYYMFSSHWPKELGFSHNWLFNSEIIVSSSDKPEGPYKFEKVVLPRRGHEYFDGMNTHNTCIKQYKGKFYLYYMGTTYDYDPPKAGEYVDPREVTRTWNTKRIGLAISDNILGPYVRLDKPLLEPREYGKYWDGTITTNPTVAILPSGKTYMIYKSRQSNENLTLKLGVAVAPTPSGPFTRLSDEPILQFDDPDVHVEDPFLWYDSNRNKFCLVAKDDVKNGKKGLTKQWGDGFYAESDDCIHFVTEKDPAVYSRDVVWKDGHKSTQGNLERVSILFDDNGEPDYMFFASGTAKEPYNFTELTYILSAKLVKKEK